MNPRLASCALMILLGAGAALAQSEPPEVGFRRGNESASRSRWEDALSEYAHLEGAGVRAPSLYWNWAQAAALGGRKGEAVWALLRAQELAPHDAGMVLEIERLRAELGLDPSEISLGFLGDARRIARRLRFDGLALAALLLSLVALTGKKPRTGLSLAGLLAGLALMSPYWAGAWREPRGVVVQKEAPLMDVPRDNAVALSNLREGEVVPLLGAEGEYVRIQDASGARGFAHKADVRPLGAE